MFTRWSMLLSVLLALTAPTALMAQEADQNVPTGSATAAPPPPVRYRVDTFGSAPKERPNAREDAINDALRRAVEQAGGIKLTSWTTSQDMALASDYIISEACGIIQTYNVISENPDQDGQYYVRLSATVIQSKDDIDKKAHAFEALMHQVGRPRILVVGAVDGRPFDHWVTGPLNDMLDQRGFTVMSLDNLDQRRTEDMARKIQVDHDAALSAIIDTEVKADYYVVVRTQLAESAPIVNDVSQMTLYPIGATAEIDVVQRDSSRLMASKTVDVPVHNYLEPATGRRKAEVAAAETALDQAIGRIAQHWLHDYNSNHSFGGDIEIVVDRYTFKQIQNLVQKLRKIADVQRIDIDSTDEQGRSSIRVATHATAPDLAVMLRQVDPTIASIKTSKNQIEIGETVQAVVTPIVSPTAPPEPHFSTGLLVKISFFISATLAAILGIVMLFRRRSIF